MKQRVVQFRKAESLMAVSWKDLKRWSELYLERMEDAGVARVVLNRPDKRNAQTGTLVQAFFEALEIIRADLELKVVITKGAGTSFSAGLDLHYLNFLDHEPLRDFDRPAIYDQAGGSPDRLSPHHHRAGARLLPRRLDGPYERA